MSNDYEIRGLTSIEAAWREGKLGYPADVKAPSFPATYRGWTISRGRWPEPNWMAVHPNYDASWEGEEDGWVDNGLKADAPTYEALCEEIDIFEEELKGSGTKE